MQGSEIHFSKQTNKDVLAPVGTKVPELKHVPVGVGLLYFHMFVRQILSAPKWSSIYLYLNKITDKKKHDYINSQIMPLTVFDPKAKYSRADKGTGISKH